MGHMRFVVPHPERLPPEAMRCIYLSGMEGIPWRCHCRWIDDPAASQPAVFAIERRVEESGNLYCPWYIEGVGELTLSTASLMERPEPYNLPVELARGLLNRLRNQTAEWKGMGLQVSAEFDEGVQQATRLFVEAVTGQKEPGSAAELADAAMSAALAAVDALSDEYARQALAFRHQQSPQLPTLLGVRLQNTELDPLKAPLLDATNAAAIAIAWRELESVAGKPEWEAFDQQIEWCREHGLRIVGGPLLELSAASVPDWLYLWDDDFPQVQAYLHQFIKSVVARYRGRVQIWNCAGGMNVRGSLALKEEQKLRLVVGAIDEVRRGDPQTPLIVTFDQPWGEYLAFEDLDLSPLHFADSLVRADLGIAGIGLDLNIGYWPGGTLPRHRLEFSRMLDRWSMLGLPLIIYLSAPSQAELPSDAAEALPRPLPGFLDGPTPQKQQHWAEQFLPLLLAKPYVQGVFWNQLADDRLGPFPYAGLFDARQQPKPALAVLSRLRHEHLQ